jgi:pyruvate formate lyase activating enzyme
VDARKLAIKAGLKYVYTGNIDDPAGSTTYCPNCKKPLILRSGFSILGNNLEKGRCKFCKEKIKGIWST